MVDFRYYWNLIKDEIKMAFKNNKLCLFISILIFVIPLLIGFYYPDSIREYVQPIVDNFEQQIEDGTVTLTTSSLFYNNFKVDLMLYALSALGAVLGVILLANNGLFVGFFQDQIDLTSYLLLTVPHGIFEIPAIIISTAGGFVLFVFFLRFIWNIIYPDHSYTDIFDPYFSNEKIGFWQRIVASFNANQDKLKESFILLCISVVLLFIAAIIEANFTIPFAEFISNIFNLGIF
ncbi:stage II sporulation protein M [uncultured Methanobrevibacter sp.]|uniref:stage II sporulation protein M n=1 Tax=uncultured Methanobrevibacter sp. TaxID=253161 RepID=UPI002627BD11